MVTWHDVDTRVGDNGFGKIDPYIDWAFGNNDAKIFRQSEIFRQNEYDRIPILLCLNGPITVAQFAEGAFFSDAARPEIWKEVVRVPPIYLQGGGPGQHAYFTALVQPVFFRFFTTGASPPASETATALLRTIARMAVSRNLLQGTIPEAGASLAPAVEPTGRGEEGTVVVGIIDDGIGFANCRFRTAEGHSRVEHIWLQDSDYNAAAARYGYGRSLSKADIDAQLHTSTYSGLVDEDEVYVKVGALDFGRKDGVSLRTVALHGSHGTHVMDLACGYDPGTAPKSEYTKGEDSRPIVCVQLPAATSEGTSGASLDTFVIDGIRYILDKADEIARSRSCGRLPVVINFSYGTIAGRHDGTSDIERAIDELIIARRGTKAPLQVVIPAGNSRLKKCHAHVAFVRKETASEAGSVQQLYWRVPPDDRTTNHLEIWLPPAPVGTASRVKLSVKPPFGEACLPLEEQVHTVRVWGETREKGMCYVRYSHVPEPTNRGMFLITLKPTEPAEDSETGALDLVVAPAGIWTIILENVSLECEDVAPEDVVHAWIQRDDTRYGHLPFGRQSFFDHADHVAFGDDGTVPDEDNEAGVIRRSGTLNAIATERHTIVVGGLRRSDMLAVDYSGEGPTSAAHRCGPDALAASDDSIVHSGVLAAGTRSGSVVALAGTSVAAPLITRMVADLMSQGKSADRAAVRALAAAEETAATDRPPRPSKTRGGKGRLNRPGLFSVPRVDATN